MSRPARRAAVVRLGGFLALAMALPLAAHDPPRLHQPREAVVLTITGAVRERNQAGAAVFDLPMLEALPQHQFSTRTPWDRDTVTFSGPRLREVLAAAGAQGSVLHARALNDYEIEIPMADAQRYDVIIATRKNGARMPVREYGPLFIVYPFDSDPALRDKRYYERSVWQLRSIEVR
jgi:hypothetical protein